MKDNFIFMIRKTRNAQLSLLKKNQNKKQTYIFNS